MIILFYASFVALILAELIKGLSANGTPPLLQKYSWQMDLAYLSWTSIAAVRIILGLVVGFTAIKSIGIAPVAISVGVVVLGAIWGSVFWLFNRFWVGKHKFLPISQKVFVKADANDIDLKSPVLGVNQNGVQKAYPVNMLFYHHQITDEISGKPIWVTYCGLCRSGRVYDIEIDGQAFEFSLVGAITFNAVFRDAWTGSWWRQETGEAAKGPLKGQQLLDVPFEQMSLKNWLAKYPDSDILQFDPTFENKYRFLAKLLSYEASLPGWHRQETPPLIVGVETGGNVRAYDWNSLQKRQLVMDDLGGTPLLVLSDAEGSSAFVYERTLNGTILDFELTDSILFDTTTGSTWDQFGRCISGEMKGSELVQLQSHKQFLRAWVSFHPATSFYDF